VQRRASLRGGEQRQAGGGGYGAHDVVAGALADQGALDAVVEGCGGELAEGQRQLRQGDREQDEADALLGARLHGGDEAEEDERLAEGDPGEEGPQGLPAAGGGRDEGQTQRDDQPGDEAPVGAIGGALEEAQEGDAGEREVSEGERGRRAEAHEQVAEEQQAERQHDQVVGADEDGDRRDQQDGHQHGVGGADHRQGSAEERCQDHDAQQGRGGEQRFARGRRQAER
jgi:hypothetical protein